MPEDSKNVKTHPEAYKKITEWASEKGIDKIEMMDKLISFYAGRRKLEEENDQLKTRVEELSNVLRYDGIGVRVEDDGSITVDQEDLKEALKQKWIPDSERDALEKKSVGASQPDSNCHIVPKVEDAPAQSPDLSPQRTAEEPEDSRSTDPRLPDSSSSANLVSASGFPIHPSRLPFGNSHPTGKTDLSNSRSLSTLALDSLTSGETATTPLSEQQIQRIEVDRQLSLHKAGLVHLRFQTSLTMEMERRETKRIYRGVYHPSRIVDVETEPTMPDFNNISHDLPIPEDEQTREKLRKQLEQSDKEKIEEINKKIRQIVR
jgi:hypothetical protein